MEPPPPPPEPGPAAHELSALAPVHSHESSSAADTPSPGTPPATSGNVSPQSPASPSGVKDKPRVRFNSAAAVQEPPAPLARSAGSGAGPTSPSGLQKPRPALSRNPYSYNSTSSDIPEEPQSPEKVKSATEAAKRAQALAQDTSEGEIDEYEFAGSTGRSSFESEAVTEASYNEHGGYAQIANETESDAQAAYAAEADRLLRAHRMQSGNPYGPPGKYPLSGTLDDAYFPPYFNVPVNLDQALELPSALVSFHVHTLMFFLKTLMSPPVHCLVLFLDQR